MWFHYQNYSSINQWVGCRKRLRSSHVKFSHYCEKWTCYLTFWKCQPRQKKINQFPFKDSDIIIVIPLSDLRSAEIQQMNDLPFRVMELKLHSNFLPVDSSTGCSSSLSKSRTNTKFAIVCVHGILHAANFNRDIFMNNMKRKPQTYVEIHTWTISLRSLFSGSNSTISSSSIDQVHDSLHRICSKRTHRSVGRWVEICLERCLFTMQKWSSACARDSSWVSRNVGVCMHVLAHFQSPQLLSLGESLWSSLSVPNPEIFLCYASY